MQGPGEVVEVVVERDPVSAPVAAEVVELAVYTDRPEVVHTDQWAANKDRLVAPLVLVQEAVVEVVAVDPWVARVCYRRFGYQCWMTRNPRNQWWSPSQRGCHCWLKAETQVRNRRRGGRRAQR